LISFTVPPVTVTVTVEVASNRPPAPSHRSRYSVVEVGATRTLPLSGFPPTATPFRVQEAAFEHVQESVAWPGGATMPGLALNEEQVTRGGAEIETETDFVTLPPEPVQVRE
jgi:hypothetical protein